MNITKNYHSISASCTSKLQIIKKISKLRQFVKPLFQDLSIFYLEFLVENVSKYSDSSTSISSLEQIALLKSHSTCSAGVSLSSNFRLTLAIFRMFFSCVSTQRFFPSVSLITKFAFKRLTRTNVIIKLGVVFKNGLATWT